MDHEALPIIDTHQHLWDLTKFRLPWLDGAGPLNRSFLMSDYLHAARGLNVVKTVYMEVDLDPALHEQEAACAIDLCRRDDNPMAAAVISGRPNRREFMTYIETLADEPSIKGVRQVLHSDSAPRGLCLEPQFIESVRLLGDLGMCFDLCMRPGELLDAVRLVDRCPETRFVLDHCGNLSVQNTDPGLRAAWEQGLRELAQREHVVCKISGIIVTAKNDDWSPGDLAPNVECCIDAFGEDRILFAGDWPVCTLTAGLRDWAEALLHITRGRPPAFRRKLFYDNAVKFYGLA